MSCSLRPKTKISPSFINSVQILNKLRVARVVRRLHGGVALISQRFYHLEQLDLITEVQSVGMLVHKDHFRALHQRARDVC